MNSKTKRICFVFLTVVSLNIVGIALNQTTTHVRASTAEVEKTNFIYPKLFVVKNVDKTEVVRGESFVVNVIINNFGNKTAYNVTFIDQLNQPWVFEVSGLTQLSYGQIDVNETRKFSYLVTAKSLGTYYLFSALVEYYDSELNPTKFKTISNNVEITVIETPEDFSLANFYAAITLLITLVILDILLVIRLIAPMLNRRGNER
ncbi:MAG: BatD family protein [Promethearchaeota archaeon]